MPERHFARGRLTAGARDVVAVKCNVRPVIQNTVQIISLIVLGNYCRLTMAEIPSNCYFRCNGYLTLIA